MERKEYEPVIAEWVEEVLKHGVSSTLLRGDIVYVPVEEVLKHGVSSTNSKELLRFEVEKILFLKAGVRENKMKMKKISKKFTSK
jgi:hypothetical protein